MKGNISERAELAVSKARVRLLLARMGGDSVPSVVAAVDEVIWENWTDEDDAAWIKQGKETWGIAHDTEFRVVVAEFSELALAAVFATPLLRGALTQEALP